MIDKLTFAITFAIFTAMVFVYVHRTVNYKVINDEVYKEVGMLEYRDGDKILYIPVYKNTQRKN